MNSVPELLAPAGDMLSFRAAIENGADAVYLGINKLNARVYASNFSLDRLEAVIDYAHLRGVKVYLTLNTLLKDDEIIEIINILHTIISYGLDAIIAQDIGLITILKKHIPDLSVHASTQMTAHNLESVQFLKKLGIRRVILARELSLEAISYISQHTDVELEVFAHGALCISYSGQCLFSSMIGGRSGNRGYCAQPCRKQYKLKQVNKTFILSHNYLLSPKDLNTSLILPDIIRTGITSLKIEGRMKRPEYVAGVVRIYKNILNRCVQGNYYVSEKELHALEQLFNRGFTHAYFSGKPYFELMDHGNPFNRGIYIGSVVGFKGQYTIIKLTGNLSIGDGIGFSSRDVGENVTKIIHKDDVVNTASKTLITVPLLHKVPIGTSVYKTSDVALLQDLNSSFRSDFFQKKVFVNLKLTAIQGLPLQLTIEDQDKNIVHITSEYMVINARNNPTTILNLEKQISKFGNTVFEPVNMDIVADGFIFVPIKELNLIRNTAIQKLIQKRINKCKRVVKPLKLSLECFKHDQLQDIYSLIVCVNTKEKMIAAINAGSNVIYFGDWGFKSYTVEELTAIYEIAVENNCALYLITPVIVWDNELDKVQELIRQSIQLGFHGIVVGNLGVLQIVKQLGCSFIVDHHLNVLNSYSLSFFVKHGAQAVTLSVELNMQQIKSLCLHANTECLVHGDIQLMVMQNCVINSILNSKLNNELNMCPGQCKQNQFFICDKNNFEFPVITDDQCRNHILNSRKLCLLDNVSVLMQMGIKRLRIEARNTDAEDISKVVYAYKQKMDGVKSTINCKSLVKNYTKGHYLRGIL